MLNRDQLAVLAVELQDARYADLLAIQAYGAVAALINAQPVVANPQPQPQVPRRVTLKDAFAVMTQEDLEAIKGVPDYAVQMIIDALIARDLEAIQNQIQLLTLWGFLSAESVQAIQGLFAETVPDPAWQPTVLGPSRAAELGLPRVSPADVQAVEQGVVAG